jgi:hypothetical protein
VAGRGQQEREDAREPGAKHGESGDGDGGAAADDGCGQSRRGQHAAQPQQRGRPEAERQPVARQAADCHRDAEARVAEGGEGGRGVHVVPQVDRAPAVSGALAEQGADGQQGKH